MAYTFASIIDDAAKARWRINDVLASLHDVDFSKPFLPDALVRLDELGLKGPEETLRVNQIRGHGYVQIFALVERFILPFVMLNAADSLHGSSERLLALMQFGEEEAKHIALFERFAEAFQLGFGTPCAVVGPSDDVAGSVLVESPLAVGLAVLHIEWMTQEHYLASVRHREDLCPAYKNMLRCHWMEEAQHARLDTLVLDAALEETTEAESRSAIAGYLRILDDFERAFAVQVELDLEAARRDGIDLGEGLSDRWRAQQNRAYQHAFLHAGITHPRFVAFIEQHFPDAQSELSARAESLQFAPN